MSEQPSVEEFERLLSRGRGKAILHLKQHDAAPYRETLLRCCVTDTIFDARCETTRAPYLIQAIELSGHAQTICDAVILALHTNRDFELLFPLLSQLAQKGFPMARQAMYAWCRIHYDPQQRDPYGLWPLVELDGPSAFLFLLNPRQSPPYLAEDGVVFEAFRHYIAVYEETWGKSGIWNNFRTLTQGQPILCEIIDKMHAITQENTASAARLKAFPLYSRPQQKDWRDYSYAELCHDVNKVIVFSIWAKKASDADLYAAAVDFNTQDMPINHRLQYAQMFGDRPFPLDNLDRLLELLHYITLQHRYDDTYLSPSILRILGNISHPRVRALALELITTRQSVGSAVALLKNNFENGDWLLIDTLFDDDLNDYDAHMLVLSTKKLLQKHSSYSAIPVLIHLFEANPCSHCRMDVVESLVSLNALPDWIAEECFYDANLGLRAYAERGFKHALDDD